MYLFVINQNSQSNGDHEVHNKSIGCSYMPNPEKQVSLGYHNSCSSAISAAKSKWPQNKINGCFYCCNACHTS
ncbi:hypothetical protein CWB79_20230 [Pseudoalteromonas sp. S1649]|nr:hypothetical protein CWB80_00180 [Pseudoalteromonas sp. S1650]TMP64547.1 hypothetical protein CWB79_20230 [Pseudoalteromonas sp. S1649]